MNQKISSVSALKENKTQSIERGEKGGSGAGIKPRVKRNLSFSLTASLVGNLEFSTKFTFLELLFKISSLKPLGFSSVRVAMYDQKKGPHKSVLSSDEGQLIN